MNMSFMKITVFTQILVMFYFATLFVKLFDMQIFRSPKKINSEILDVSSLIVISAQLFRCFPISMVFAMMCIGVYLKFMINIVWNNLSFP